MCKQSKEDIQTKTANADYAIWIAITSVFLIIFFAEWGKTMVRKMALKHDINTVTPSDYVLHMFMNEK